MPAAVSRVQGQMACGKAAVRAMLPVLGLRLLLAVDHHPPHRRGQAPAARTARLRHRHHRRPTRLRAHPLPPHFQGADRPVALGVSARHQEKSRNRLTIPGFLLSESYWKNTSSSRAIWSLEPESGVGSITTSFVWSPPLKAIICCRATAITVVSGVIYSFFFIVLFFISKELYILSFCLRNQGIKEGLFGVSADIP